MTTHLKDMAIANAYDYNKFSNGNGIADKVWGAVDGSMAGLGKAGVTKGGGGGKGGGGAAAIGSAIDMAWGIGNNLIGDVYSKGRSEFDTGILNTAYGKSSDDPFFGGIGRERNARSMATGLRNEGFSTTARNMGDLAREAGDTSMYHNIVDDVSQGKKVAGVFQNSASGAAKGAKIGSNFGPWGMAIGAIAGGVGGAVTRLFGNRRSKRRLDRINRAIAYSNNLKGQQSRTAVTNMGTMQNNRLFANMAAYSGAQPLMRKYGIGRARLYAEGGSMSSKDDGTRISQSKDEWPGITEINAGGSHEENPRGGVLQGVGPDGVPNLVEEGEVKMSDIIGGGNQYVLSARLVIDAETAGQFGIDPKLVGKTYAEGFKAAYGKYKDRQGHAEVRNEVAHLCDIFQAAQDAYKAKREAQEQMAVMASLSPEQRQMAAEAAAQQDMAAQQMAQEQVAQQQQPAPEAGMEGGMEAMPQDGGMAPGGPMGQTAPPLMAYGGRVKAWKGFGDACRRYDGGGKLRSVRPRLDVGYGNRDLMPWLADNSGMLAGVKPSLGIGYTRDDLMPWLSKTPLAKSGVKPGVGVSYTEDDLRPASLTKEYTAPVPPPTDEEEAARKHDEAYEALGLDAERRKAMLDSAPVWASLGAFINSKKYEQDANRYNNITREGLSRSMVSPERLGGYYRPRYVNPDYANDALRSTTAQALRNAAMLSGGNRAAAAAAQSVAMARANEARGEQLYKAQIANEEMRRDASQRNNAIDQTNAQMRLQADSDNATRTYNAYNTMMETAAAADQYNKDMRMRLMQNAANMLGKYGVSARNRLTAGVMAAHGLLGKGAENVYNDLKR